MIFITSTWSAENFFWLYVFLLAIQIALLVFAVIKKQEALWLSLVAVTISSVLAIFVGMDGKGFFAENLIVGAYALIAYGAVHFVSLTIRTVLIYRMGKPRLWVCVWGVSIAAVVAAWYNVTH